MELRVVLTKAFRSGADQAVHIPAELAFADVGQDLQITRLGEVITIFPARSSLLDAVAALRSLPKPGDVETRDAIEVPMRDEL